MNKKFSTLLAAFLAAGSFVSVEAGVVKVTTPVNGKSYVIAQDVTPVNGAFPAAGAYVLNANAEQTGVVAGTIAEGVTSLADFTKWVFGTTATASQYYISLNADSKYLHTSSATAMDIQAAKEETNVAKDTWVVGTKKLGADYAGTTTVACTDQIKFTAGVTPSVALDNSGDDMAFYAENYDGTEKETMSGMEFLLKNSVADDEFVFIKIGDKFVSVKADGSAIEMVSADALKTTKGKFQATFKVSGTGKKFTAVAKASSNILTVGANSAPLTLGGSGTDFFFDESATYDGQIGASMYGTAPSTAGGGAVVVGEDGMCATATGVLLSARPEAKIYKSSNILMATPGSAAQGMPKSLVYAEDFVNGGSYYLSADADADYFITTDAAGALTATQTPGANALWKVAQTKDASGNYSYTFYNEVTKTYMKALASGAGLTTYTSAIDGQGYTGGIVLANTKGALTQSTGTVSMTTVDAAYANQIIGLYRPGNSPYTAAELSAFQNGSFSMTIALDKETTGKTIKGADLFGGNLIPVGVDGDATRFRLLDGTDDDAKYIVLDKEATWGQSNGLNGVNNKGLKFAKVAAEDLDATKQFQYFSVGYPLTNGKENNQELVVEVFAAATGGSSEGRLFITTVDKNYYLTVAKTLGTDESWAYVKTGGSDLVDLKTFLQKGKFYTLANVNEKADKNANYNKVLGTKESRAAAWLDKAAVQLDQPEGQWAATVVDGKLVFTNRESQAVYTNYAALYKTDKAGIYTAGDDKIAISVVEKHTAADGYEDYKNVNLRDEQFTVAAYSNVLSAPAYFSENHAGKHLIGLDADKKNATTWAVKAFDTKKGGDDNHKKYTDSTYVISQTGFWNATDSKFDVAADTLKMVSYTFTNVANGEPIQWDNNENAFVCDKDKNEGNRFVLKKMADGKWNMINVVRREYDYTINTTKDLPNYILNSKVYGGFSAKAGNLNSTNIYDKSENDLMIIEKVAAPEYRKLNMADTIRVYRNGAEASVLFEKGEFLGMENTFEFDKMTPAMYVDTAYYNRANNNRWQYLLGVNIKRVDENTACDIPGHPSFHADTTYGRFLVNLVDSAEMYAVDHLHTNKYVNTEDFVKLGFVKGFHTNDTLVIQRAGAVKAEKKDSIYMGKADFNYAKFAFRIVDQETKSFKIETAYKQFGSAADATVAGLGYLKWMNGFIVVVNDINNGDTYNLAADKGKPVDNEGIETTEVSVIAGNGQATIKNAEGKTVAISNILGQALVNTVLTSDNATIAVPAGIVVVAIEGETAVKAIIK